MLTEKQQIIIDTARSMLGVPFRHQGRNKLGCDCAGVVIECAKALGIPYQDIDGYGRQPHSGKLQQALDTQAKRVSLDDMQPGDILLMRFGRDPQHLAIYIGDTIIHSYSSIGKVVEHRLDDKWRNRIVAIYRFPGVD